MHGNRFISALLWLWLAAMAAAALSCTKEIEETGTSSQEKPDFRPTSEVTVEFNILDPDALPGTKAITDPDETLTDGWLDRTDDEKVINNLYLFVKDVESDVVEAAVQVELTPGDYTSTGVRCGHTFKLSAGTKRFYAGANMTEAHVAAFSKGEHMKADSHEAALAMVMKNGMAKDGSGTDIMMFSRPATDETGEADINITGKQKFYLSAQLKRSVAKVLVLGKASGTYPVQANNQVTEWGNNYYNSYNHTNYIVYDSTPSDGQLKYFDGGWFDINSGSFILYNANKATFVNEQPRIGSFPADPNWALSEWVETDLTTGKIRHRNMADFPGNFETLSASDIMQRLSDDSGYYSSPIFTRDENKLNTNQPEDHYTQGLYCLENTVYDDMNLNSTDKEAAALLTTTHVYLRMRFLPKHIQGKNGTDISTYGSYFPITPENAIAQINYANGNTSYGEDAYTFWVFTDKDSGVTKYANRAGMERLITAGYSRAAFTKYEGGWVYYRSFIEDGRDAESWGIRRNDYCILTILGIDNWGSNAPGEAFIKIKSETTPWVKKGNSEITVTPE